MHVCVLHVSIVCMCTHVCIFVLDTYNALMYNTFMRLRYVYIKCVFPFVHICVFLIHSMLSCTIQRQWCRRLRYVYVMSVPVCVCVPMCVHMCVLDTYNALMYNTATMV